MNSFDIEIRSDGSLTFAQYAMFAEAAARWSQFITADVPDVYVEGVGYIDDLLVDVRVRDIDGPRKAIGRGSPTLLRKDSLIPARGLVEFDKADLELIEKQDALLSVLTHELGHVLGIGTLWPQHNLIEDADSDAPLYVGSHGMAAYGRLLGHNRPTKVPIDRSGMEGTRLGHWCESVFGNELMTGFLNKGVNPLSELTAASLRDLGYEVNTHAADPYKLPDTSLRVAMRQQSVFDTIAGPGVSGKRSF